MENTQVSKQQQKFETVLSVVNKNYMSLIEEQMVAGGAEFDEYSAKCVMAAMSSINNMIHQKGITFNDLNGSNMTEILLKVATLKLNANASPRECYFQLRNVNIKDPKNPKSQGTWEKQIEFGFEGDGNDALLARFGRDVKKVGQFWLVRSGDKFEYPKFNGLDMTPPQWQPTGEGEVVRIVYPILKKDNTIEFYIGERREVLNNLLAHISNNLMNETFGICEDRYKATADQKSKINEKKKEIMKKVKGLGLDAALDCEELQPYISPAWTEYQSRELMIIRKIRNNIVKKIPKDFGSGIAAEQYNMMDETYREVRTELEDKANTIVFETDKPVEETILEKSEEPVNNEELTNEETADSNAVLMDF
jgi:hypothetical protein